MICKHCGVDLPNEAKFCYGCGSAVEVIKWCTECGKELVKGARFCTGCGVPLAEYTNDNLVHSQQSIVSKPEKQTLGCIGESQQKAREFKRESVISQSSLGPVTIKSPVLLTAIIGYTAFVVLGMASIFSMIQNGFNGVYSLLNDFGIYLDLRDFQGTLRMTILPIFVPNILMAVGMWMSYLSGTSTMADKKLGLNGIRMIKIIYMISFVISGILTTVLFLIGINVDDSWIFPVLLGVSVLVFYLFYMYKLVDVLRSFEKRKLCETETTAIPMFVIVMCFIVGGFQAVAVFGSTDFLMALSNVASATAQICFGIHLYKLKTTEEAIEVSYVAR